MRGLKPPPPYDGRFSAALRNPTLDERAEFEKENLFKNWRSCLPILYVTVSNAMMCNIWGGAIERSGERSWSGLRQGACGFPRGLNRLRKEGWRIEFPDVQTAGAEQAAERGPI